MPTRNVHYVLSTHWDREWHQNFQDFRARLVAVIDDILLGFEQGELQGPFQVDGQAIPIEDYLEVRPERTAQVMAMIRDGRFVVGPWYVLPDEWLVSGESIIRNLELGRALARRWGAEPSSAGFVCDLFGHVGQLPQLLAGFGVRAALLWRGLSMSGVRHLNWTGADGTTLPCYRFGRGGYCDYAFDVRRASGPEGQQDAATIRKDLRAYLDREAAITKLDPILAFDGGDHQAWDRAVYARYLAEAKEADGAYVLKHTTLDAYLEEMLQQQDRITETRTGELRETGRLPSHLDWQFLISAVLASRPWIKQQNAQCQTLLCHWAEPMGVMAEVLADRPYPGGFLDVAWKWLLRNHPHDSICGCSIDAVHEAMRFRFQQSRQIARGQAREAMRSIAASVEGVVGDDEVRVVLFNPLPRAVDDVVELNLDIPDAWPSFGEFFGYEDQPAFRVHDADGDEMPYQRVSQAAGRLRTRLSATRFPRTRKVNEVGVAVRASVPALGYTTLTIRRGRQGADAGLPDAGHSGTLPTRHPVLPSLVRGEHALENEHLRVAIEADGALTLTDKAADESYGRLLTFEDGADIGDGWNHNAPVNNATFVSTAAPCTVSVVRHGPLVGAFRIRTEMKVPASMDRGTMRRSDDLVVMPVTSTVTLRAGSDLLEVETTVGNTARDHRLRVVLPTGAAAATTYLADGAFDVVERDIALHPENHTFREVEVEGRPQQSFTAVAAAGRGLATVCTGMMESAVLDRPDRAIALTLFRATAKTVMTDGEPGGQVPGKMTFRFWIMPIAGAVDRARLLDAGQRLAAGLEAVQLGPQDLPLIRAGRRALPRSLSLCQVDSPLVLTSLRKTARGIELRLFNPRSEPAGGGIACRWPVAQVDRVSVEGDDGRDTLDLRDGRVMLELGAKEIATLLVR